MAVPAVLRAGFQKAVLGQGRQQTKAGLKPEEKSAMSAIKILRTTLKHLTESDAATLLEIAEQRSFAKHELIENRKPLRFI